LLVGLLRAKPVATLRTVNCAPNTVAPEGSVTVPWIVPVDWAVIVVVCSMAIVVKANRSTKPWKRRIASS
jgi:hypothetical protein